MVNFLIWISVIGIYIQTPECCEEKWVAYDRLGVCYRLYTTPRLEWLDAKDFCSKQDAKLTDLNDYTEQMFVKDNLLRRIRAHGVWIGISDDGDEGDWRWVNNSQADIDRFEWWPGNPDNANVQDGFFDSFFGEDCVEISLKSKYRGQLNDYHCEERMPFICKKKDISTTTTTTTTTTLTTSVATESDTLKQNENKSIVPVVSSLTVLCLIALLVAGSFIYLRRYRKRKSTPDNYEDANFTSSANENIYTCLDTNSQSALNNNIASCDQNSIHEYHSVHFSAQGSLYESVNCNKLNTDYQTPPPPRKY